MHILKNQNIYKDDPNVADSLLIQISNIARTISKSVYNKLSFLQQFNLLTCFNSIYKVPISSEKFPTLTNCLQIKRLQPPCKIPVIDDITLLVVLIIFKARKKRKILKWKDVLVVKENGSVEEYAMCAAAVNS